MWPTRYEKVGEPPVADPQSLKQAGREWSAFCASLIDLGDGVVCCEFHSKNAIGAD